MHRGFYIINLLSATYILRLLEQGQGLVQGEGRSYGEGAAAGADEAGKVGAGVKGLPKVPGKGPDVGAFRAGNPNHRLRQPQGRCICHIDAGGW